MKLLCFSLVKEPYNSMVKSKKWQDSVKENFLGEFRFGIQNWKVLFWMLEKNKQRRKEYALAYISADIDKKSQVLGICILI